MTRSRKPVARPAPADGTPTPAAPIAEPAPPPTPPAPATPTPATPAPATPASATPAEGAGDGEVVWELGGIPKKTTRPPEPKVPLSQRLRRISPGLAILTVAAVLSLGFLLFEIGTRTASVQLLTSAGLVCGLVYMAVFAACAASTWRLGREGRLWPALLAAFIGGCAAFVAAGSFAGALVLVLALGF